MNTFHPEFVVDEEQNRKAVLLPYEDWQKIVELLEELEDISAYDQAREAGSDPVPFDQAVKEIRQGKAS